MKLRIFVLALLIFILNLIWEFAHYPLYVDLTGIPKNIHLIWASFIDLIFIFIVLSIVSLKNKSLKWIDNTKKSDYLLLIILTLLIAALNELINLNIGRWQYTSSMPTIFSIGIFPLIQLAITSIISLLIYKKIKKK
jgi:hypothetical protein